MIDDTIDTLIRIGQLVALVTLPVVIAYGGERMLRAFDTIAYHEVPGLARASALSGVIAGGLLLWANHESTLYEFDTVFSKYGPWAVPFVELFTFWLDPFKYSPAPLIDHLSLWDWTDTATRAALISAGLAAFALAGSVGYFGRRFPRAVISSLLVWLWGLGLAIYVVCAAAWSLNMLNFWAVVLWFFAYRYRLDKEH